MKKSRNIYLAVFVAAALSSGLLFPIPAAADAQAQDAEEEQLGRELYAESAVLMDADTGRVLFEKNGMERLPNASTTKILTCLVALEHADMDDVVTFSNYAASQARVRLGAPEGSSFYMRDMLLAMMLESFNDTAVAVAETVAGSVGEFAVLLNRRAQEIGCTDTYFITPNGLDAADENGSHSTTAADLALIMAECIQNGQFLEITRTAQHSFSSIDGTLSYTVSNKNAFLTMMDGVLSGKTGFTGAAGYCYVCAFSKDGRNFTLALLACGWPDHKTYKWKDAEKLLQYGMEHYEMRTETVRTEIPAITVKNGWLDGSYPAGDVVLELPDETKGFSMLLGAGEHVTAVADFQQEVTAPADGTVPVGTIRYYLLEKLLAEKEIFLPEAVAERTFQICFRWIFKTYCQPFAGLL